MKTTRLSDLQDGIRQRKAALGFSDAAETEAMRNKGFNRTASKRAFLARIEARAASVQLPKASANS